jgi:hypothetical protein
VLKYKSGKHLAENNTNATKVAIDPKYEDFMIYRRCVKMEYDTAGELCYDGEIYKSGRVDAKVIPAAVKYIPLDRSREKNNIEDYSGKAVTAM